LRVAAYQVRNEGALAKSGVFYDPRSLSGADRKTLRHYAGDRGLKVLTRDEFIDEVFFPVLIDLRGTSITFNGAFDYARIAIAHGPALSPSHRGGFWLAFNTDRRRPHLQIRHLSGAESLIRFTQPDEQPTPRGMRRRGLWVSPYRGNFTDVRALAAALLEHHGDLASLGRLLGVPTKKGTVDFEAKDLTPAFLDYTVGDVQLTWECYERLAMRYARLGLATPLDRIYSAASIAKAQFDVMGVRPWTELQPDFSDELIGLQMSSYFGGRSEVHLRRVIYRVLYADFLSMYPTACVLLGLWRFVIARRIETRDATAEIRALLGSLTLSDLQKPDTWKDLTAIVQLEPDDDLLPVRATYDGSSSSTIGLNFLSGEGELVWYALPDVVNAAIRTGRIPRIVRAFRFAPGPLQDGLRAVDLMGNPAYRVDPAVNDVFRRLIELRAEVRRRVLHARHEGLQAEADRLDAEQQALKIIANSMSYGIFVELNVTEWGEPHAIECFGRAAPYTSSSRSTETPGRFFHPLLATLLTSAARLLLGLAEHQIEAQGLDWAFCDTDSMAIAQPPGMPERDFLSGSRAVLDWFEPLKPYAISEPLFKLENANFALEPDPGSSEPPDPLYCLAISDKRYVLFNVGSDGRPILRKASAHGLGHLRPPYGPDAAPTSIPAPVVFPDELGVSRWQHDLWYRIVEATLEGHAAQVRLDDLPGFGAPAHSQYAATTPNLLHWFDRYNEGKVYREQVRPFGFLSAFQARRRTEPTLTSLDSSAAIAVDAAEPPAAVATFHTQPDEAAARAFDRHTGVPIALDQLLTYREVLAQYHLHPEAKFEGGRYLDAGPTRRRHVAPLGPITNISKEANRWEEQAALGMDATAHIQYGAAPAEVERYREAIASRLLRFPVRAVADRTGVSLGTISNVRRGIGVPRLGTLRALDVGLLELEVLPQARERMEDAHV
jgi:hypothetical protein